MKEYVINPNTLAIMPFNSNQSIIYEGYNRIIVDLKPNNIIKKNCLYDGNSYQSRIYLTEKLLNVSYKVPILINKEKNIIFFPTTSPRLKCVCWLNLNNLDKCIFNRYNKKSIVKFINGIKLEFDVSLNVLNNQILKSTRLEHNLLKNNLIK